MTETLLPCPFCGVNLIANNNPADMYVRRYGTHYMHPSTPDCCHLDAHEVTPSEVELWNRRASSPPASEQERTPEQLARDLQTNQEIDAMVREMKQPSDDEVAQALQHLESLCEFAYEQGFHELGYNPLRIIRRALALHAEPVEKMKGEGA